MDRKRILWGLGLAPLVVLFILYAPVPLFKLIIIAVAALCLREFMTIALPAHPSSSPWLGVGLGIFLSGVLLFAEEGSQLWMGSLALILFITFAYYLFIPHELTLVLSQIPLPSLVCCLWASLFFYRGLIAAWKRAAFGFSSPPERPSWPI